MYRHNCYLARRKTRRIDRWCTALLFTSSLFFLTAAKAIPSAPATMQADNTKAITTDAANAGKTKALVRETTKPTLSEDDATRNFHRQTDTFLSANDNGTQTNNQTPYHPKTIGARDFLLTFVFLILVIGIILLLSWLFRRFGFMPSKSGHFIQIVSSLSLGPKEKLILVDIHGQQILLGICPGSIQKLLILDQKVPLSAQTEQNNTVRDNLQQHIFMQFLQQYTRQDKSQSPQTGPNPNNPDKDTDKTHEKIQESNKSNA